MAPKAAVALPLLLLALCIAAPGSDHKLIALTFDDGPRPYVLFPQSASPSPPGLLDVLDKHHVKATFFVMGWRLVPGAYDRDHPSPHMTYRDAALELFRRGHEIENHTFSHVSLISAEKKNGDAWVDTDVERASGLIQQLTGSKPSFLRAPSWVMDAEQRGRMEAKGYRVMTISGRIAPELRDVNSEDYFCVNGTRARCPQPSLDDSVLRQIAQRERRGVYTHILVFHELPSSIPVVDTLISQLESRGYRFLRLDEYMHAVLSQPKGQTTTIFVRYPPHSAHSRPLH